MLYKIESEFMQDTQAAYLKQFDKTAAKEKLEIWEKVTLDETRRKISTELASKIELTIKESYRGTKITGNFIFITKEEWQPIKAKFEKLKGTDFEYLYDEIIDSILAEK